MGAFLQTFYPLLKLVAWCYFTVVDFGFRVLNQFIHRNSVSPACNDLCLLSATDAAIMIRNRELLSVRLVDAYISRIEEVNPIINAVVEHNFVEAHRVAEEVDQYLAKIDTNSDEYKELEQKKPFLGVPFTVKDTLAVKGFHHTAGLPSRITHVAPEDAEVVKRMRESGAILLGVSNVPEAATWFETANMTYGRTNNPYDDRRSVGGSSGGEGALLASAASVIGIGSDIGGSIRIPAIMNGVFGLKPSEHVTPLKGGHPPEETEFRGKMLVCGPMCRYAKDLSLFLRVLAGPEVAEQRLRLSQPVSLRKTRFFFMEGLNTLVLEPVHRDVRQALGKTVKYFEKKYDISVHKVDFPLAHHIFGLYHVSLNDPQCTPFYRIMSDYDHDITISTEFVKSIFGKSEHTLPAIMVGAVDRLPHISEDMFNYLVSQREKLRREVVDLLGDDGVLIFPSFPTVAPFHNKSVLELFNFLYTGIWNALRLPVCACPLGLNSDGLPLSVQLVGGPDSERLLIAAANDLEEGFGGWVPPRGPKSEYMQ